MIEKYYNLKKLEENYYSKKAHIDYEKDIAILQKEKEDTLKKLNKISERFAMLYDDKADGIISPTEFIMIKNKYQNDTNNFNLRIESINNEMYEIRKKQNNVTNENSVLEKYTHLEKLSRLVINEFISKILVGKRDEDNNRPIKIIWDFTI